MKNNKLFVPTFTGEIAFFKGKQKCRGRDLNPRTSAGQGPEPCAVGQAWLPLHQEIMLQREKMMRTPGFEPGLRAWKALIITPRSHPRKFLLPIVLFGQVGHSEFIHKFFLLFFR